MPDLSTFLTLIHLFGLALGVGAATVKVYLLSRCVADSRFVALYLQIVKPITRIIVLGLILLTLSGLGWLFVVGGYAFTPRLIFKLALVAAVWIVGPIIDNFAEPRYRRLAPVVSEPVSAEFLRAQKQYLGLELFATGLFYVITIVWVLF
jgi:hypothetical protein